VLPAPDLRLLLSGRVDAEPKSLARRHGEQDSLVYAQSK
jgi:hypothetical protein